MAPTASEPAISAQVRSGLVCLFSGLTLGLAGDLVFMVVPALVSSLGLSWRVTFLASSIISLGSASLLFVGLLRCRQLPVESETRLFVWMALVGWLLLMPLQLISLVELLLGGGHGSGYTHFMGWAWRTAGPLAAFGLNLFLRRLARWRQRPIQAALATANLALVLGSQVLSSLSFITRTPGQPPGWLDQLRWALFVGTAALEVLLAALALWGGDPTAASPAPSTAPLADPGWAAAARGLRLHRTGVLARLVVMIAGALLVALGSLTREPQLSKALMVLLPLGGLVATGIFVAGLVGFLRAPAEAGGRELGMAALAVIGLGAIIDLYSLTLVWDMLEHPSFTTVERIQQLEPFGLVTSLAALLLLLGSLRRVARYLELGLVVRRTVAISFWAGGLVLVGGAVKARAVIASLGSGVFLLAVPALGLAIWVLVRYLGLLRELADTIEERAPRLRRSAPPPGL
jgi:hypothetical protein